MASTACVEIARLDVTPETVTLSYAKQPYHVVNQKLRFGQQHVTSSRKRQHGMHGMHQHCIMDIAISRKRRESLVKGINTQHFELGFNIMATRTAILASMPQA